MSLRDRLEEAHKQDQTILTICLAERLISSEAEDPWLFEIYARSLIGIGRYDDAVAALNSAESLAKPLHVPWIIHRRAVLEERRGNFEAALNYLKKAHMQMPDEASFLIYAGSISFRLGRLADAEEFARRGTKCTEGYPDEAWHNLGGYLAAQQRYDEALLCYENAIAIDPDYKIAIEKRDEILSAFPNKRGEQGGDDQSPTSSGVDA